MCEPGEGEEVGTVFCCGGGEDGDVVFDLEFEGLWGGVGDGGEGGFREVEHRVVRCALRASAAVRLTALSERSIF